MLSDRDVQRLTQRFLRWQLPEDFSPDAGITFTPDYNLNTPYPMRHRPVSTNLLTATQAEALIRYLLSDEDD